MEQPPVAAYIHLDPGLPRKPHYPPCIRPGSFCWSVNATTSTPCCLRELSPRVENGEEERRKKTRPFQSLFLSTSVLKKELDVGSPLPGICCETNPSPHFKSWSSAWNGSSGRNKQAVSCPKASAFHWYQRDMDTLSFFQHGRAQPLITRCCSVTPVLTREIAAVLNWNIIPVLPVPPGTAYELMRCQQRCHVFIHSISPKEKKTYKEELVQHSAMNLVCLWGLDSGGLILKNACSFCFVMTDIHGE